MACRVDAKSALYPKPDCSALYAGSLHGAVYETYVRQVLGKNDPYSGWQEPYYIKLVIRCSLRFMMAYDVDHRPVQM